MGGFKQIFAINEMRVKAIQTADIIAGYVVSLLIVYLTRPSSSSDATKLNYIKAAAVVNVFKGVVYMLPAGFSPLAEASDETEFRILSLSSISYCMGLSLLVVTGSSNGLQYPAAFYVGLIFLAVGMAGQSTTAKSFLEKQESNQIMRFIINAAACLFINMVGTLFQYFISNWRIKCAIATIFMVIATLIFLSGICCCKYKRQWECHWTSNPLGFVPTCIGNCLPSCRKMAGEKADKPDEPAVHLIPMFMTFIICGVVCSTGYTFFLAQADTLNSRKLVSFLVFFYNVGKLIGGVFIMITNLLPKSDTHNRRRFAPSFGIGLAMLLTVLTTITAALVETKRRNDKSMTSDKSMMIWWLLPQSVLVGGLDGIYEVSIHKLFDDGLSTSREKKIPIFANAVFGAGIMGNALLVFIVSKASKDMIPEDLNSGYLTKYYWLLTVLSALNLLAYLFIAIWFAPKSSSDQPTQGQGESTQHGGEPANNDDDDADGDGGVSEKEVKNSMC